MVQVEQADIDTLRADAAFMRRKLAETRESLAYEAVVIPYDNGGGQEGIRANPAFSEYEKLAKTYQATLDAIERATRSADEEDGDDELDRIAARRAANADALGRGAKRRVDAR